MNWNLKKSDNDKLKKQVDLMLLSNTLQEIIEENDKWINEIQSKKI